MSDEDTVLMSELVVLDDPNEGNPFRIGDIAHHKYKDLDGREVVDVCGDGIRIQIGTIATPWLEAAAYERTPNPNIATDAPTREISSEED